MNADLIAAAILFGPAALATPPLLLATRHRTRHGRAVLAMLAQERALRAGSPNPEDTPPPDGGQPTPAPQAPPTTTTTSGLAPVIPLHRHAA